MSAPSQTGPPVGRGGIARFRERIPVEIRFILLMFLATRASLMLIGVLARPIIQPLLGAKSLINFYPHLWLDIWGVYDTRWYLDIAQNGYSTKLIGEFHATNFAFFPAYPFLMKSLGILVGSPYVAGLMVSNVCLLITCVALYHLARLDYDAPTALGAVKYLFLFPTAFIYSAVLSESLFVALLVGCFYFARTDRWLAVGTTGFALALARPLGVIAVIPLLLEYAIRAQWNPKRVKYDIVFLFLIPAGLAAFAAYNYGVTGDPLAFVHIQARWYKQPTNPLHVLVDGLAIGDAFQAPFIFFHFGAYFSIAAIVLLAVSYRGIRLSYWMMGMGLLLLPLATGTTALTSMPRFALVVFPLYVILARVAAARPDLDQMMTVGLALFQGGLMAFWSNGVRFVI